ncbi:MAG: PfkB family carbohydrate kinase [Ginsengibacter sp.]
MMNIDLDKIFQDIAALKVVVIGDVMLDTYWWGHVERISPEAPVPIVSVDKREQRIGGAGNVAYNVQALGASVSVISVLGNDDAGTILKQLLEKNNIDTTYIISSGKRITTNKIRIISRNQHMMRLDAEKNNDLEHDEEEQLLKKIKQYIQSEKPHVIILEDYDKGVLTNRVITSVIEMCARHKIILTADPKRKNFFTYKGVHLFKPNLKEVKESLNILSDEIDIDMLAAIHQQLIGKLDHHISLITLSEKGIFYQSGNNAKIIPSHIRNVADVSGAGDTVIAVASLIYAVTKNIHLTAEIANIAGGLVCEEVGTAAVNKQKLLKECYQLLPVV